MYGFVHPASSNGLEAGCNRGVSTAGDENTEDDGYTGTRSGQPSAIAKGMDVGGVKEPDPDRPIAGGGVSC